MDNYDIGQELTKHSTTLILYLLKVDPEWQIIQTNFGANQYLLFNLGVLDRRNLQRDSMKDALETFEKTLDPNFFLSYAMISTYTYENNLLIGSDDAGVLFRIEMIETTPPWCNQA